MTVRNPSLRAPFCAAVLLSVALLNGCAGARELMLVGNSWTARLLRRLNSS